MIPYKIVDFSYPSSTNAARFGFNKTGCYTVSIHSGVKPPEARSGHKTYEEARAAANVLPERWAPSQVEKWRAENEPLPKDIDAARHTVARQVKPENAAPATMNFAPWCKRPI